MSSKTKIVVLHLKELIYTGIFVVLGILFIVLLIIMFIPNDKKKASNKNAEATETSYIPGVYTSSLILSDHIIDIEVVVDEDYISSIRLVNLDEAITTMFPLIQPAFDSIAQQVSEKQSLENITYSDDSKYTTLVLLQAVRTALDKATVTFDIEEGILP
ncbi:MAG TPA: hypothetical protein VJY54_02690 [Lachnospiraceae bacterium]|nr:hypothetical protein [Lachnospiraceae bacterium]